MKKKFVLKETRDFNRIIQNKKAYKYKDYIIYIERTNDKLHKFGISVGKKVGHAVVRNRIKRQIRSIIDKKDYQNGFNCIIIVGRGVLERTYSEMEINLFRAFEALNIYTKEGNSEK